MDTNVVQENRRALSEISIYREPWCHCLLVFEIDTETPFYIITVCNIRTSEELTNDRTNYETNN